MFQNIKHFSKSLPYPYYYGSSKSSSVLLDDLRQEMQAASNPEKAKILSRFFKTGPGEYGQGDVFIGITVPQLRAISKKYKNLSLPEIKELLYSPIHEQRLVALLTLVGKYKTEQETIVNFYIDNLQQANNWDLVDLSARDILGSFLEKRDRSILYELANSDNVWKRRVAIIATHTFIRVNDFEDTLRISKILLHDKHDLIQKAVGWMLREVGNRDMKAEENFLTRYHREMSRITLRYAIEKFPEQKRLHYLGI